jgi:hypothetical protein
LGSGDFTSILVFFWIILMLIWNSTILEIWKRKTNEINYRWGTVKLENEKENE